MSIEKFNPNIRGETIPYLQVNRNVVQSIRDPEVLAVWVYLLSLPSDWEVIKNHLQTHFKIGERKIKSIFSILRQHKLIEYIQHRNSDGTLGKHEIVVLNGSIFTELFTKNTGGAETARAENRTCGNADLHIKQTTNKTVNKKSFCEKDQKQNNSVDKSKQKQKEENKKKHSWAEKEKGKKSDYADVTKQSNSYKPPIKEIKKTKPEVVKAAMLSLPKTIRPRRYRSENQKCVNNNQDAENVESWASRVFVP